MKWNRYRTRCPFRELVAVEYEVKVGKFTLGVGQNQEQSRWHYGVRIGTTYLFQNSGYASANEAKEAAVIALRVFLEGTLNLLEKGT